MFFWQKRVVARLKRQFQQVRSYFSHLFQQPSVQFLEKLPSSQMFHFLMLQL